MYVMITSYFSFYLSISPYYISFFLLFHVYYVLFSVPIVKNGMIYYLSKLVTGYNLNTLIHVLFYQYYKNTSNVTCDITSSFYHFQDILKFPFTLIFLKFNLLMEDFNHETVFIIIIIIIIIIILQNKFLDIYFSSHSVSLSLSLSYIRCVYISSFLCFYMCIL